MPTMRPYELVASALGWTAVAAFLASGCTQKGLPGVDRAPIESSRENEDRPKAEGSASTIPNGQTPPSRPRRMREVELRIIDAPQPVETMGRGTALRLPGDYGGRTETPPRWIARGRGHRAIVIDRVTGKRLGTMDAAYPDRASERHGVLPGLIERDKVRRSGVMFLDDGRIVVPEPRTRDGRTAVVERILLVADADPVLVTAKDRDGALWYGPWPNLSDPVVVLTHTVPIDGKAATWTRSADAWELFGGVFDETSDPACPRVRLRLDGPRCIGAHLGGTALDSWLGDWLPHGGELRHVIDDRSARGSLWSEEPELAGRTILLAALEDPVRALFAWQTPGTEERHVELVGPEGGLGRWSFAYPAADANSYVATVGSTRRPIVPQGGFFGTEHRDSAFWVDLEKAVVVMTEPLDRLHRSTTNRRVLAVRHGSDHDVLVLLDFDQHELTQLGPLPACDGSYWPAVDEGDLLGITCSRQPNPDLFVFEHVWTQIVDLRRSLRHQTQNRVLDVLPDRRVVLSNNRTSAAESRSPSGRLYVVDLAQSGP
jgi:hypothetical protein